MLGVLLSFFVGVVLPIASSGLERRVTLSEAIAIAQNEARSRGYKVAEMSVEADEANSAWAEYLLAPVNYDPVPPELKRKLRDRIFYAIYLVPPQFDPKTGALLTDRDIFVFVDKATGVVIAALGW